MNAKDTENNPFKGHVNECKRYRHRHHLARSTRRYNVSQLCVQMRHRIPCKQEIHGAHATAFVVCIAQDLNCGLLYSFFFVASST